jgi:hypothetical protein
MISMIYNVLKIKQKQRGADMKNTMKRAHEIRREAAKRWNCKVSEIIFSICLKMVWAGETIETEVSVIEALRAMIGNSKIHNIGKVETNIVILQEIQKGEMKDSDILAFCEKKGSQKMI